MLMEQRIYVQWVRLSAVYLQTRISGANNSRQQACDWQVVLCMTVLLCSRAAKAPKRMGFAATEGERDGRRPI